MHQTLSQLLLLKYAFLHIFETGTTEHQMKRFQRRKTVKFQFCISYNIRLELGRFNIYVNWLICRAIEIFSVSPPASK